jgi:hypothetical protein
LPTSFDYELNADYSSSTLEGGLFPATVTGFGSVDSLILNDQTLFGDSDHAGGFSVNASGAWSFGLSNLDPSEDRTGKRGLHCSRDGSSAGVIRCETTSSSAGPDGADPFGNQSPNLPGANAPFGGASLSPQRMLGLDMTAAQNNFAMTSPGGVIQGTLPPACGACEVTPPVVDGANAPASDFGNPAGIPNSYQPPDPTGGGSLANFDTARPAASIPEIPPPAMLVIGFAGLALIHSRRRWRLARLGSGCAEPRHA